MASRRAVRGILVTTDPAVRSAVQEFLREANTIGSKCKGSGCARLGSHQKLSSQSPAPEVERIMMAL